MIVGVPREAFPAERRVALVPSSVAELSKAGLEIRIESGAGVSAGFPDAAYAERGAQITSTRDELFKEARLILQVRSAGAAGESGREDLDRLHAEHTVIGFSEPLIESARADEVARRGVTAFSMELIPRITRAQSMDALSSMATVAGYKAVLLAAGQLPRLFPMMMTAAGTLTPSRVLVIGAGVAGLQAIATARRLGASVKAYDVRPAVKEQVESLGAKFVELPLDTGDAEDAGGYAAAQDESFYKRQREMMTTVIATSDVVITTALIPGKAAPLLVTTEMIDGMAPGSVVVDLAAERGGNCEPTVADTTIERSGITIMGPTNLPSTVPSHASQMYAKNITTLVLHLVHDGSLALDLGDEITARTLVSRDGAVVHPRVLEALTPRP